MTRSHSPHPRPTVAALAAAALLALAGAAQAQDPPELFGPAAPAQLDDAQREQLELYRAEAGATSARVVEIDTGMPLGAARVSLTMAPGLGLVMSVAQIDSRADDDYTWFGEDPEQDSSAVLVVRGDDMTGTVRMGESLYRVRPLGGGLHALIEVDPTAFPDDHPPEYEELERLEMPPEAGLAAADFARTGELADACDKIDLIVAYTEAARRGAGNIDALLQLAVDETNRSYGASGIPTSVRLVHSYETGYTESGSLQTDRDRFRIDGDGVMDEIHARRNAEGGDVALLVVGRANRGCGLASAILANATNAFAVVRQDCATGNYSFGHEIGHLQGARHNPEADPNVSPFPHGHGFLFIPSRWRTVMSYDCSPSCGALRRPVWSSPSVRVDGVAAGTAATHHNARVLSDTACMVANFRAAALRLVLDPARLELRPGETATLTASVEDGGAPLAGIAVELRSADPMVATVTEALVTDAAGTARARVTAVASGTAQIRGAALGVTDESEVVVRESVPAGSLPALLAAAGAATWWLWRRGRRGRRRA